MTDTLSTTSSFVHNFLPEVMGAAIGDAIYSESIMLSLMKVVDIGSQPTKTAAFNFASVETAAATSEAAINAAAWVPTNATIGVSEIGARVSITKLAQRSASEDLMQAVTRSLGQALLEKFETDACALLGGFSNTVTSSGVNITIANVITALTTLRKNAKSLMRWGVQCVCCILSRSTICRSRA